MLPNDKHIGSSIILNKELFKIGNSGKIKADLVICVRKRLILKTIFTFQFLSAVYYVSLYINIHITETFLLEVKFMNVETKA